MVHHCQNNTCFSIAFFGNIFVGPVFFKHKLSTTCSLMILTYGTSNILKLNKKKLLHLRQPVFFMFFPFCRNSYFHRPSILHSKDGSSWLRLTMLGGVLLRWQSHGQIGEIMTIYGTSILNYLSICIYMYIHI